MRLAAFTIMVLTLPMNAGNDPGKLIRKDSSLIIPGKGSERIMLGDSISSAQKFLSANSYTLSVYKNTKDIFNDIFQIKTAEKIFFDKIYHYTSSGVILFTCKKTVSAIAGLQNRKVTSDAVGIADGSDNFIFNYGNSGLEIKNRGRHVVYVYRSLGIAIFDDNNDNSIDMYLIFPPTGSKEGRPSVKNSD